MAESAGKRQFDRTLYGGSGGGGSASRGGSNPGAAITRSAPNAGVMGSPSQVMDWMRATGKVKRNNGRGRRPPARSARRGR